MPVATEMSQNEGKFNIEAEVDLSAAAAVGAIRGTGITCQKTGTGAYSINYLNRSGIKLFEVLERQADLTGTPATAFWAKIISVTQAAASNPADTTPDSPGDIVVTIQTLNNAATPAAADTTGACTLTMGLVIRAIRDPAKAPL